ncbi:MAG: hypothetical protein ACOX2F_02895 [bacterium]
MTKNSEQIYNELIDAAKLEHIEVSKQLKKSLHLRLCSAKNKEKKNIFSLKLVPVAALFIFLLLGTVVLFKDSSDKIERRLVHESTVSSKEPLTIKLTYNAIADLQDVKFSLLLDEGIYFYSKDLNIRNKKSHEWTGNLKKGENQIPFVVETNQTGKMKIVAKAASDNFRHLQEIVLDVQEKKTVISMFVLVPSN